MKETVELPHVITRQVHIRTHRCATWQNAGSDNFQQWKLLVTVLTTMMTHYGQQVQTLCGMWKPLVKQVPPCAQQISPFSCLVPHQKLNAALQPMHPGVYPYRASSTEFLMYIRRG